MSFVGEEEVLRDSLERVADRASEDGRLFRDTLGASGVDSGNYFRRNTCCYAVCRQRDSGCV